MIRVKSRQKTEYGDFQTPIALAEAVCRLLRAEGVDPGCVLEPTCGQGTFLEAAANVFSDVKRLVGREWNREYVAEARRRLGKVDSNVDLAQADFFQQDWSSLLNHQPGHLLVLGNPPWVTNSALGTLGVSWDKLQWLVAALSVGLGFGLQEIFANFISGLIILFERPIRIGDTITLGNLHGTVSRIRIRATTVTDFDRKEIIIPNKTFVTDQLINWSLSDNVTRVVLTYGVVHGSDLATVHRLLRQAADENVRVLADPEPQVFFMETSSYRSR